jgi:hypothetical protein
MKMKTIVLLIVYVILTCITIVTANLLSLPTTINGQFFSILIPNILICVGTIPIRLLLRKNDFLFCRIVLIVVAALLLAAFGWSYYYNWIHYIYHTCLLGGKTATITEVWSFVVLDIEYVVLLFTTGVSRVTRCHGVKGTMCQD